MSCFFMFIGKTTLVFVYTFSFIVTYLYVISLSLPSLDLPMRSIIWYYLSPCFCWHIFQLKSRKNFIVIIAGHSRNLSKSGLKSPRSSIFTGLSGSVLRPLWQPPWMAHGDHYSETIFTPKYCIQTGYKHGLPELYINKQLKFIFFVT